MSNKGVRVKNPNIKSIFEKMEYSNITENIGSAKVWLAHQKEVFTLFPESQEECKVNPIIVKDVTTSETLCTVFSPKHLEVDKVILKSKQSDKWFFMRPWERAKLINRLADEILKNSILICQLEMSIRGILTTDTKTKALPLLTEYLRYYSSWAANASFPYKQGVAVSFISDKSFTGFLGCIIGPALAAGYNLILQTEIKISPLAQLIINLAESIGIPKGTLTLIPGTNFEDLILQNNNVDIVSFLGKTIPNIYIGQTFLSVNCSKSPMIIFNSADIDAACDSVIDAAWGYQGLLPWSVNTLLVQEDIFGNVVDKLKYKLGKIKMSSATNKSADLSHPIAITAKTELRTVINEAKLQGIEVFQVDEETEGFQPTLFIGGKVFVNNVIREDNEIAAVTILAFRTASEAINLANNSRYGFGASVWTENIGLANETAKGLKVSNVWVNSHGLFTATTGFSPFKKSGLGNFGGAEGIYEYAFRTTNISKGSIFTINNLKTPTLDNGRDIFISPIGNDFHNIIKNANKAYHYWSKLTIEHRSKYLRAIGDELNNNIVNLCQTLVSNVDCVQWLVELIYSLPICMKSGSTSTNTNYTLQTYYEAVGVVVLESPEEVEDIFIRTILTCILLGNSVIVSCYSTKAASFCVELSKLIYVCNIPSGVFNVIAYNNENVVKSALSDHEIGLYINLNKNNIQTKVESMQRFYGGAELDWNQVLNRLFLIKNVWFNVGHSVL